MAAQEPVPRSDRRSRRSRAALEGALLTLIAERDLAQISIAEVIGLADLNRSTFYTHYSDVHDLASSACTAMFDELIATTPIWLPDLSPASYRRGRDALLRVLAHVQENARLYRALLGGDGSARVIDHLHRRLTIANHVSLTVPDAENHVNDPTDVPANPVAAMLAGALLGLLFEWLRRDCQESPEQLADAIAPRLTGAASPLVWST